MGQVITLDQRRKRSDLQTAVVEMTISPADQRAIARIVNKTGIHTDVSAGDLAQVYSLLETIHLSVTTGGFDHAS